MIFGLDAGIFQNPDKSVLTSLKLFEHLLCSAEKKYIIANSLMFFE